MTGVTVWVPSLGTRCGIAEYSAHLAQAVTPRVTLSQTPPDPANTGIMHIQHEYALYDDDALTEHVTACRKARVPVAVTQHSVIPGKRETHEIHHDWERLFLTPEHDWEREADVLVSLSGEGADVLRSRWPGKQIAHIPHACPTWFPERKKSRGRVIGAFGFLAPYKGFGKLLDVLRAEPGTELLMYSHPADPQTEHAWEDQIKGLPVRWERTFRPEWEVAKELAAHADILAYWYDEGPFHSASGAVRLGMATGVPVLTSQTRLFSDLTGVTHQTDDLLTGVRRLLEDDTLRREVTETAYDYCHVNSWSDTARRHTKLWQEISG